MAELIPLFPLGQVLMPGRPLPLRVFEPRYRQLLADIGALEARTDDAKPGFGSFGVVLLNQGIEVNADWTQHTGLGSNETLAGVGTIAEILELHGGGTVGSSNAEAQAGYELLTVGSRRFRIREVVGGKPYAQAQVEMLEEQDGPIPPDLPRALYDLHTEHGLLLAERTGRAPGQIPDTTVSDPHLLSYLLAAVLPLSPQDRQALLEAPTTANRLSSAAHFLRREIALLRTTGTIAVAPDAFRLPVRPN